MTKSPENLTIVANWKMYKTIDEAISFINAIKPQADACRARVYIAVPFTAIKPASDAAKGSHIVIGAQNMNDASEGAFTGEIAASMIRDAGGRFVIVGHSERRRIFQETNEFVNRKVKRALSSNLQPILCIGETFQEREENQVEAVLARQLDECLADVPQELLANLLIAYEPVWAIGTGLAATSEIAAQVHHFIRGELVKRSTPEIAKTVAILYGGSVSPENAKKFLEAPDIDGLLIGNASLRVDSFAKIIELSQNM